MSRRVEESRRDTALSRDRVVCVVVGSDPFDPAGPLHGLLSRELDVRRADSVVDAMRLVVGESTVEGRPLVLLVCGPERAEHEALVESVRVHAPRAVVRLQRGATLIRPEGEEGAPPPGGRSASRAVDEVVLEDAEVALLRAVWDEWGEGGPEARARIGGP